MQIQCPNCGGYKVSTETRLISTQTGKALQGKLGCGSYFFIVIVTFLPIMIGLFLLTDRNPNPWGLLPLIIGGLISWGMIVAYRNNEKQKRLAKNKYYHACNLCGYNWSRLETEPLPSVHVRPDLIEKGVRKLEEEQAAAAKAQQDAAAAQFLNQRRGK